MQEFRSRDLLIPPDFYNNTYKSHYMCHRTYIVQYIYDINTRNKHKRIYILCFTHNCIESLLHNIKVYRICYRLSKHILISAFSLCLSLSFICK